VPAARVLHEIVLVLLDCGRQDVWVGGPHLGLLDAVFSDAFIVDQHALGDIGTDDVFPGERGA